MPNSDAGNGNHKSCLVIGGGIAGITAAIEAAEAGLTVVLVEKEAFLGGQVARLHHYFPKLCPPACGLEIHFKRLRASSRITVLTLAELEKLEGSPGDFLATIRVAPRFVTAACTSCGACLEACTTEIPDSFEFGMAKSKAIYTRRLAAYPTAYAVDRSACSLECGACAAACKYGAIDFAQEAEVVTFRVGSVVLATGWKPYDAARLENLGFGKYANVVTNLMFERLAAIDGPTHGKVLRPSDQAEPKSIAFVQCAGSRDHNHLPYCSSVCCTASLKQAGYVRSQYPDAKVTIFYIDLRTPGPLQAFATKICTDQGIELVKGKVGKIEADPQTGNLQVTAEDVPAGKKTTRSFEMAVLATGMVPQTGGLPVECKLDEFGFVTNDTAGIFASGCAARPSEVVASVRGATGAALRALQIAMGAARND